MTHRQRSTRAALVLAILAAGTGVAPGPVAADPDDLTWPHLAVVPRSAAESARIAGATAPPQDFTASEPFETNPGGAATTRARTTAEAFSQSSANMPLERELDFKVGNGLFKKLWVSSPASTLASDGLGPVFNARSCQRCHLKDGRGHPPEGPEDDAVSMFLRISVPAAPDEEISRIEAFLLSLGDQTPRMRPDPTYGGQLQDFAVAGHRAEYRLGLRYDEIEIALSEGETASLRKPTFTAENLGYGPLAPGARLSPRVAPPMIGLGLLEAIPAADILALADPEDADDDGISGRAQVVWSFEHDRPMLGRFGWKAGAPTIREQSASAFSGDLGISSPLFPAPWGDCAAGQQACRQAPHGDGDARTFEIDTEALDLVTFYSRNLAVPARRDVDDAQVLRGKQVFHDSGCAACHTPKFVTHRLEGQPEQSFQLIWPMTDLLLHDMGEGLADHRPEGRASGREWRTAPLWGIGLTEQVNGHTQFLHDGRARSLLEAVIWHGGEAQAARDTVVKMPKADRVALIRYLESL
ncbi:di-heme oxidoredictase family protein [Marinovum sp.]|uniref:di-heme oxidoreductase family protein n=1 Tax=Marinovum sp. TaxID=2024839 RepID=UPI002B265D66|nr:di-heme oxidoredictase family protein [Marinovum sp.]